MAIDPSVSYPGKIGTPSADYPYGSAQNITSPGDGTGTPWEAALVNDIFGFQQELLSKSNITPTGNPEKVNASQYLDALRNILGANVTTLNAAGSPYTLTQAQAGFVLVDASAGAVSVTLPAATVVKGINFKFIRIDTTVANSVTINRAGADLIDGATSFNLLYKVPVYLDSDNSSNWYNSLYDQSRRYQQTNAAMAANAVTISALNSAPLQFRSATAGSGAIDTVSVPSANLVIPSGATLGTVSGVKSTIVIAEMNNGGVREYAVANISGGLQMDESNLISTTAISAASGSANVWYSTAARSNLPYRIVAYFESTQATAGAWASAASLIQFVAGLAGSSLAFQGLWVDVKTTPGRAFATTYTNTSNDEKDVIVTAQMTAATSAVTVTVNGVVISYYTTSNTPTGLNLPFYFKVPAGQTYSVTATSASLVYWVEK